MGDKGASGALETNNREAMPAMPRISIRSDLFRENRNANVVQNMMLMQQLESPAETEDEVEIVKVVEGNVSEELEMKEALEKTVFGGLLAKAARKPARKGLSVRTGRGGRNELKQQQGASDVAVLNYMLGNIVYSQPLPLSLYGHKSKKRKRSKRRGGYGYGTFDAFDDSDDDYQGLSVPKIYSTSTKGRPEGEQEREEVLLGESTSGHSEASCQESTPQIWLPTADIDQEGQKTSIKGPVKGEVKLPGKKKEMLTDENKKAYGSDEVNDLLVAAGLPVWQSQNRPGTNMSNKQVNSLSSPVCPEVEEGEVLHQNQDNSLGSSDFDSVLKVGSARTHSRLPPCAPTSSSSRTLGAIDATKAVGKGPRLVPVSYKNPLDLTITHFAPVYVATNKEEACAKALVAEKNAEFNMRNGRSDLPVKYTTAAVVARTILNTEVVKHIDKCFTQKEMKTKVTRGSYLKRRIGPGAEQENAGGQEKSDEECQVVWASGAGNVSAENKQKTEVVMGKLKEVNQTQRGASSNRTEVYAHGISSGKDLQRKENNVHVQALCPDSSGVNKYGAHRVGFVAPADEVKSPKTDQWPKLKEKFPTVAKKAGSAPRSATPWRFSPEWMKPVEGRVSSDPVECFQERQERERVEKMRRAQMEREEEMRREQVEYLLDRRATSREREEKMKRAKKEHLVAAGSDQEVDEQKSLLAAWQPGKLVVDVNGLYTLRYDIEGMSSKQMEREEQMRKVKVMLKGKNVKVLLPKLATTLTGRLLMTYKQELGEILRAQRRKLNMPVL